MKKVLSMLLLAALLATMIALPVSAEAAPTAIEQSSRDDVLILFDGSTDNVEMQHPTSDQAEFYEDSDNYIQGDESLFVDMPTTEDCNIGFVGNFALMLKIKNDEPISVEEYPISELSVYNHQSTRQGENIQINYVDPDNSQKMQDDSYNADLSIAGWEPGWHRLTHNVLDHALWDDLNPHNISHMRVSWTTVTANGEVDYQEIDWNFDCLIIAKQSFFDDRAVAEEEMIGIIDALETPTADNIDSVKESIEAAKEKLDDYLYEFPNFLIESTDTIAKMNEVWSAYRTIQAQVAANIIIEKINTLGELTLENYEAKKAEIEAIDTEIKAYTDAGYSKKLITNTDTFEAACITIGRLGVEVSIDALPATDAMTAEDIEKINEVKTALAALNAEQQALIPQEKKDKLSALVAKLVENKIDALPAVDALTLEDEEAVTAAKTELEALTEAEQALVAQEMVDKLTALEVRLEELKNPYTLGDVNGDEDINASDALMALQHSVKLVTLDGSDFDAADVDGSEAIDATDALYILQYSVKLIEKFPAEQ